jgi:hypothetical protein
MIMNISLRLFYALIFSVFLFFINACDMGKDKEKNVLVDENESTVKDSIPVSAITFDTNAYNFGVLKEGEVAEHVFKFRNTGNAPLIVRDARASCGCTIPEWSKDAIPVGGEGKIEVKFNSSGKGGQKINKQVTVYANTNPAESLLFITGEVIKSGTTGEPAAAH